LDDGIFKLRVFDIPDFDKSSKNLNITRTKEEIEECTLDINRELGLDNHTMPIDNFPDPFINCCFIDRELENGE
jgi:hypothetical protein